MRGLKGRGDELLLYMLSSKLQRDIQVENCIPQLMKDLSRGAIWVTIQPVRIDEISLGESKRREEQRLDN